MGLGGIVSTQQEIIDFLFPYMGFYQLVITDNPFLLTAFYSLIWDYNELHGNRNSDKNTNMLSIPLYGIENDRYYSWMEDLRERLSIPLYGIRRLTPQGIP